MEEFRKEPVTIGLILINILVFLAVEFTGGSQNTLHMLEWGAAYTPGIVEDGEFYRLFTSMFLHFGIEHLANNMLVLFVLGSRMEQVTGRIRFSCYLSDRWGTGKYHIYVAGNKKRGFCSICRGFRSCFCSNGSHDLCSYP